jgi:putative nucleotidyltransferase with HDIG domain
MIPNQILNGIQNLDPLPVTARKLATMLRDESASVQEIANVVEYDVAVAANILRMANSAAYAGRYPIERIRDAVVRLGTENLLTIVLGEYLKVFRINAPLYDLTEDDLYLHSAASALMIKAIAPEIRHKLPGSTSIAALLHDIGKLIMVRYMKADVSALLALCTEKKIAFVQAERELLGCDHAEVGAVMARQWGFPQEIISTIEQHHQVVPGGSGLILDAVMLANYAAKSIGVGLGAEGFNLPMDYAGSRERLGLTIEGFERACAQVAVWVAEQRKDIESAA